MKILQNSLHICFIWMYIYKYIIFKTISVFQRQVLRVFSFFLSFFFSKPNHERTGDISKTCNGEIKNRGDCSFCHFWKKLNRHMDMNGGVMTRWTWDFLPSSTESSQRGLSSERVWCWISQSYAPLCGICSLKPGVKTKAAMLLFCIVQCLYYLIHII